MIIKVLVLDLNLVVALDVYSVTVDQKLAVTHGKREINLPVLSDGQLAGLLFEDSKGWLTRRILRYGSPDVLTRLRKIARENDSDKPHILRMIQ
jgi:hypothetical protein